VDDRILGQYRLVAPVASDAFSKSYLARRLKHGVNQAWAVVRCVNPDVIGDEDQVSFLFEDVELATFVVHPNIAEVLDVATDECWFAQEYVHGERLAEIMEFDAVDSERTELSVACRVIADAADGAHAAHELRNKDGAKLEMVHRAISPETIIVTYEGITKITDLGTARLQSVAASSNPRDLAYLAPEQARGDAVDRRTDVFALGVLLWELTTGRRRLKADDPDALSKVLEKRLQSPTTMIRDYPTELENVVMKAVALDPKERFSTAEELSAELQPFACAALDQVGARVRALLGDRMRARETLLRNFADA